MASHHRSSRKGTALTSIFDIANGAEHDGIDATVSCGHCDAVCCRLTVILSSEDDIPERMVQHSVNGPDTMARGPDGWCVAMDRELKCCSIYDERPEICRKFAMGSPYCVAEREDYARTGPRVIPFAWA